MSYIGFLKNLFMFVLILSISISLYYDSTNPLYISIRILHSILKLKHSFIHDENRPTVSADYRAFEDILRMNPLPDVDPSIDPIIFIKQIRSRFTLASIIPKPSQCQVNKEIFQHDQHTVDAYWIDYHQNNLQKKAEKILLYVHGGGYLMGDIHSYSGYECHLSLLFNVTILHLEYRLSPEHPLPAAVDDTVAIYRALLNHNILPYQLFFMGDSAGGGLSLLTIQALIVRQVPIPHGVILLSPWTDLSGSGESYTRNRHIDIILRPNNTDWMITQILGENHSQLTADHPIVSPLFGSFKGFPPMYINVGTAEILEDDSRRVMKKAKEAGIKVTFEEGLHMMHAYPMFFPYFPEARKTLENINKWIQFIFHQ